MTQIDAKTACFRPFLPGTHRSGAVYCGRRVGERQGDRRNKRNERPAPPNASAAAATQAPSTHALREAEYEREYDGDGEDKEGDDIPAGCVTGWNASLSSGNICHGHSRW
ncbi:hypothetical protein [Paraburkholderia sp. RAU2J]|uniref:hypothetical protein n=1 Tax=Paraburkholderia sp. RAU2J TaxID=1938810 RepID=UPI0013158A8E|nr:hypothetical protein [Paraburkholderia sp. RAU2J]